MTQSREPGEAAAVTYKARVESERDRRSGSKTRRRKEVAEKEMKPRDHPTGRTSPIEDEPIIINVHRWAGGGLQVFADSRLTNILRACGNTIVYQLWAEGGGPIWKKVQVPENGDTGLLMMPVRRRMRRRSKVYPTEEMEQEEQTLQSKVWPPAAQENKAPEWTEPGYEPNKSMEVVLGGLSKEVNGKNRELVMVTDVATCRQTNKMRFSTDTGSEKEKLAAMYAQRQSTDVWEREDLAGPGQEEQSEPALTSKGKDQEQ